ncbi:MAG: cytochrome c biogenesis protein ResB, partial [Prevotella sp.]|nr:cytochrome c biogenesis protein ResB [Prevotella sp.]
MKKQISQKRGLGWDTILLVLYFLLIIIMGIATIVEKYYGTDFVGNKIYGAWWFSLLWALLTVMGVYHIAKKRLRNPITILVHLSFVIILFGALITHLTSKKGMIHLRVDEPVSTYQINDQNGSIKTRELPFTITLNSFLIKYHDGTQAEEDFESSFTIKDKDKEILGVVKMNKIFSYRLIRFYQMSFDRDLRGSTLSINSDPYGIPITYFGYGLLFLSLCLMLIDPKGGYRQILRSPILKKVIM